MAGTVDEDEREPGDMMSGRMWTEVTDARERMFRLAVREGFGVDVIHLIDDMITWTPLVAWFALCGEGLSPFDTLGVAA